MKAGAKDPRKIGDLRKTLQAVRNSIVGLRWQRLAVFIPGAFLVLGGAVALIFPQALVFLMAASCVLLGAGLCFLTWKFLLLKARLEQLAQCFNGKGIEGKVILQGIGIRPDVMSDEAAPSEQKKIVYH